MLYENNELINEIDRVIIYSEKAMEEIDFLIEGISAESKSDDKKNFDDYIFVQIENVKSALSKLEDELDDMVDFNSVIIDFPVSSFILSQNEVTDDMLIEKEAYIDDVLALKDKVNQLVEALENTRNFLSPGSEYIM
ncbi:MAG: hypothetical protein GXZ08_02895 [Tissierellia bacterium]|nr:hypothetical protein [Tissierellia bacterium]